MCNVSSVAVFCSEYIDYFPGMVFGFFFKPFVTTLVALIITGTIIRFMFNIRCICTPKLVWFSFFSDPFA